MTNGAPAMTAKDWHWVTGLGGPLIVRIRDVEFASEIRRTKAVVRRFAAELRRAEKALNSEPASWWAVVAPDGKYLHMPGFGPLLWNTRADAEQNFRKGDGCRAVMVAIENEGGQPA